MHQTKKSINFTAVAQVFLNDFRLHILFPLAGVWRVVQWSISPSLTAKATVLLPYKQAVLLHTLHDLISTLN